MTEYPPSNPIDSNQPSDMNNRIFCILSYVGFLFLIGMIANPNDPKVRYHINQGLVLFIFEAAALFLWLITVFGYVGGILCCIAAFTYMIIGIVNVTNDDEKPLPFIGKIQFLK